MRENWIPFGFVLNVSKTASGILRFLPVKRVHFESSA